MTALVQNPAYRCCTRNHPQCPDCRHPLRFTTAEDLLCESCHRLFPIKRGVPVVYPSGLSDLTKAEIDYWDERGVRDFGMQGSIEGKRQA